MATFVAIFFDILSVYAIYYSMIDI